MPHLAGALAALLGLLALRASAQTTTAPVTSGAAGCAAVICPALYAPVCGAMPDGSKQTFPNSCLASCTGATSTTSGECPAVCICPAIYAPVCGTDPAGSRKTFPSSCEASCAKATDVAEGACPCICTREYMPVCGSDGKTYSNKCTAACDGQTNAQDGACPTATAKPPVAKTKKPPPSASGGACICTMEYAPVCGTDPATSKRTTYGNKCGATCANATKIVAGECPAVAPKPPAKAKKPPPSGSITCKCAKIYMPVCGTSPATGLATTYSNGCLAGCDRATNVTEGACPADTCICTYEYMPVCGTDPKTGKRTTYGNKCGAACAKATDVVEGECVKDCGAQCKPVATLVDPTCLVSPDGGLPSAKPANFVNPCFAECLGNADRAKATYYKGSCNAVCDAKCNPIDGAELGLPAFQKPTTGAVCCSGGVEFPSLCYASCLGGLNTAALKGCYPGRCKTGRAEQLLRRCPPNVAPSKCFMNPCTGQSCKSGAAKTNCVSIYCPTFFRFDAIEAPCTPVWLDANADLLTEETCNPVAPLLLSPPPAASSTCAKAGAQCSLPNPPVLEPPPAIDCCEGFTCWPGPVQRPGQIYGTCMKAGAALPIGRRQA